MAQLYGPFGLGYEEEKQRLHNLDVCYRFLAIEGHDRTLDRIDQGLVTETGSMVLNFADGNDPRHAPTIGYTWRQMYDAQKAGYFDDVWYYWKLSNATVYTTPDPNLMYIECDGQSMTYDKTCKGDFGYYLNHYILIAHFVDGKIDILEEFYNTAAVYHNYGWHREPPLY